MQSIQYTNKKTYRINVIPIETPYLKDVKEDIPFLIEYFVKRISDSNGLKSIVINSNNTVFYDYDWPGNVRELRNLIERVVILASGKNEDELFYLMARGIPENQAKRLIVQGFLSEVVEKISDENFKNYFLKKTEDMLS